MVYILHIETSGAVCSVCLSANGEIVHEKENATANAHAATLTILIEELLREQNIAPVQLSAIAVSIGPGSYTGLRIGVSASKGLCYALQIPLITISTLQTIARSAIAQLEEKAALYLATIDARRDEVYMAVFDASAKEILPATPRIVDEELVQALTQYKSLAICGNGAFKFDALLNKPSTWMVVKTVETHARYMVQTSFAKFLANDFSDIAYTEPLYLKEFVGTKSKA